MSTPRILIIDGNVPEVRARQLAAIGYDAGQGYRRVLERLAPDARCDVIYGADSDPKMPPGVGISDFDGVAVTGSALSVCVRSAEVDRQVELVRSVLSAGVPLFGSCWGLQVAVVSAGGSVTPNPLGREFGVARRIELTAAGVEHPMYRGKPTVFEAPAVHGDSIAVLPAGAVTLASNEMGLQGATFAFGRGLFWGVQYHPEYEYLDIAGVAQRYGARLIEDGLFPDPAALDGYVADFRQLQHEPQNRALLWRHGLGPAMQSARLRTLELKNWIDQQVRPGMR